MDPESRLRNTIMDQYPGVWDVGFQEEGATITVSVHPNASQPCLVELSKMVADLYRSSYYTIDVRYEKSPCRIRVLFGKIHG